MGPLKFLNSKYEVLQQGMSNFKNTGRIILEKDETCQTWQ